MMQYIFSSILGILLMTSCQNSLNSLNSAERTVNKNGLEKTFQIRGMDGQPKTDFFSGEDIGFSFRLVNSTAAEQSFEKNVASPFVTFEIYSGDKLVGISNDDRTGLLANWDTKIENGDTLMWKSTWLSNEQNSILPPGQYVARARLHLKFSATTSSEPLSINFQVTCKYGSEDCKDLPTVVITDLPPDSLHLDSFRLNSAVVKKDTLTLSVSYGGGCKEHDFTLFMSPSVFMESFPLQANLYLRHNGHSDACEAYLTEDISFNLQLIAEAYKQIYNSGNTVFLNIFEFFTDRPGKVLQVDYRF